MLDGRRLLLNLSIGAGSVVVRSIVQVLHISRGESHQGKDLKRVGEDLWSEVGTCIPGWGFTETLFHSK